MILELFAGAGGASIGIHRAAPAVPSIGIEWDEAACRTRAAAGLLTIRADVSQLPTAPFRGRVHGVWCSPPCPTFSSAGQGSGIGIMPLLADAIRDALVGRDTRGAVRGACWAPVRAHLVTREERKREGRRRATEEELDDKATALAFESVLVVEPARFVHDLRPEWVACEQVPAVLPLWEVMAYGLGSLGYETWTGVLDTADYGVAQNRTRAILMARQGERSVGPPPTTHCDQRASGALFHLPWVSMADRLGWGMSERPYLTVATGHLDAQGLGGEQARAAVERERERTVGCA